MDPISGITAIAGLGQWGITGILILLIAVLGYLAYYQTVQNQRLIGIIQEINTKHTEQMAELITANIKSMEKVSSSLEKLFKTIKK